MTQLESRRAEVDPALTDPALAAGDAGVTTVTAAHAEAALLGSRSRLRTFESLHDPNYRWFFWSMFFGFTGMSMQSFVAGWLVFELTGSFAALGGMALASGVANVSLALVGGALADRVPRKQRLVQWGQVLAALVASAMALLIAADSLAFPHVVLGSMLLGGGHALTMPARQSLAPEIVGLGRVTNAMAVYTVGQNIATLLMPILAGFIVEALGRSGDISGALYVYVAMAAIYLGAAWLLSRVSVAAREAAGPARHVVRQLVEGFTYVRRTPRLRLLLTYNVYVALFSTSYHALLPGFAKDVLDTDVGELKWLFGAAGLGAVMGSLWVATLPSGRRGTLMLSSVVLFALTLIVFALSTSYALSLVVVVLVGFANAGYITISTILLQAYVDPDYRGRVMSIYLMQFGLMSIGTFMIGVLGDVISPEFALTAAGVALLVITVPLLTTVRSFRDLP